MVTPRKLWELATKLGMEDYNLHVRLGFKHGMEPTELFPGIINRQSDIDNKAIVLEIGSPAMPGYAKIKSKE